MIVRPILFGFLAGIGLLSLYFLVMGLGSGSWSYTVSELSKLRYWVAALVVGFGIQVGLFSYVKICSKMGKAGGGTTATASSAAASTTAIIACCAHHNRYTANYWFVFSSYSSF